MLSVILWTLLGLVLVAVVAVLTVAVAPLSASASFCASGDRQRYDIVASWFHPRFFSLRFDPQQGAGVLKLLWFHRPVGADSGESQSEKPWDEESPHDQSWSTPEREGPEPPPEPSGGHEEAIGPQGSQEHPQHPPASRYDPPSPEPPPLRRDPPQQSDPSRNQPGVPSDSWSHETEEQAGDAAGETRRGLIGRLRDWIERVKAHPAVFFLRQHSWRSKVLRWLTHSLVRFFRIVGLDHLFVRVRANLEDPALTGQVYGYVVGLRRALSGGRTNVSVRFEPVFDRECLEGEGSVGLRTSLLRLLAPVIAAVLTFPYVSTFLVWRRLKREAA